MRIFVGNLNYRTDDNGLRAAFEPFGEVTEATVVVDRYSDRSRGFGFVEMANNGEAEAAIQALNGQELDDRALTVNESQPRERR
jgi:RNA recognition motif-containing protein